MGLCERPLLNNTSMVFYSNYCWKCIQCHYVVYTQSSRNISVRFGDGKSKLAIKIDIKVDNIQVFGAFLLSEYTYIHIVTSS